MNNLLQFPATTFVDRLIPKVQFVKASSTPTAIRTLLADEFEQIRLLYVLRPDTLNVNDGNEVKEIDVFLFQCKTENYSINPFCGIDDLIPRHTIYIIQHGIHYDLLMQHKRRSVVAGSFKWTREVSKLLTDVNLADRYNPQNETCDALKTKCARNKTKRFIPTKQNVPLNLCFYHSNIVFEWAAYIVRRPFL